MPITTTVEGLERYTINLRYERDYRQDLQALRDLIVPAPTGAQVPMGQLATIKVVNAAMAIKSEAAVPNAWIYVDVKGIDIGTYVQAAMRAVNQAIADGTITLPEGYSIFWSGQYEYMLRAKERLLLVVPLTLLIVALLIYLSTRSFVKTGIVLLAVPFSVVGAFWLIYLLDYNMSVAVWIGLIALAGLDAETGMVMLLYLDIAYEKWHKEGRMRNGADLRDAIYHGAVKRLRPKVMTVATTFIALVPIMWSTGTGADVMKRIAVPMIGGVATSLLMELFVYPAIFYIWRSRQLKRQSAESLDPKLALGNKAEGKEVL
jgi:Cu(I)/Ag(I) efflux system membrane protein CusA/SilA